MENLGKDAFVTTFLPFAVRPCCTIDTVTVIVKRAPNLCAVSGLCRMHRYGARQKNPLVRVSAACPLLLQVY
jgi:hypothetical protein